MPLESHCTDEVIRDLLPGYVAGSLFPDEHALVHAAVQHSPALLAEAMELQLVNEHLLELRGQFSEQSRVIEA
jgi:hypothetical protein